MKGFPGVIPVDNLSFPNSGPSSGPSSNHQRTLPDGNNIVGDEAPVEVTFTQAQAKLHDLFLNYCDYTIDTGEIFIKQNNMLKLLKDSKIIGHSYFGKLTEKEVDILVSKKGGVVKNSGNANHMDFNKFLDIIIDII